MSRAGAVSRARAWGAAGCAIAGVTAATPAMAPPLRMVAICAVTMLAMKGLVLLEHRLAGGPSLATVRWCLFTLAWPGMRPTLFAGPRVPDVPGARALALRASRNACLGVGGLALARGLRDSGDAPLLSTVLLLASLSLVLHFGLFHGLAALGRWWGLPCEPLFDDPLRARSLAEFWGRRWNLGFTELTRAVVHDPLRSRVSAGPALAASFAFSGGLHELAISVPAGQGHGGPMLYFLLQGLCVGRERARAGASSRHRHGATLDRLRTMILVGLPLPLLFHEAFREAVLWPLLEA